MASSLDELPEKLDGLLADKNHGKNRRIVWNAKDGSYYIGASTVLSDITGRNVGELIVFKDNTNSAAIAQNSYYKQASAFLLVGGILFGLFYFYLGSVERRMEANSRQLRQVHTAVDNSSDAI